MKESQRRGAERLISVCPPQPLVHVCTCVYALSGVVKCAECYEAGWQYFNGQMSELTKNGIHNGVKLRPNYSVLSEFNSSEFRLIWQCNHFRFCFSCFSMHIKVTFELHHITFYPCNANLQISPKWPNCTLTHQNNDGKVEAFFLYSAFSQKHW